jgi:arylsulfatase A-like enzyme
MRRSCYIKAGLAFFLILFLSNGMSLIKAQESAPPNIVIILTDDQGYADISFNPDHPDEVHTPHMDALANEGIFFSQAYITGNVCSPTRAGLMTGRYQQRAGIYTAGEGGSGLPLDLKIFPEYLKSKGYVSGAFGKWHLGLTPEYNPVSRGFDEFYGFMGRGAHDYFDLDNPESPLYRGLETISDSGYLTDLLTHEAIDFIKRHKNEPFFCYLAYNAVHTPAQAPAEDIADFNTGDETRNILMAMLRHLDNGVGEVVKTLKEEGVWENTLLFFLTDNGGAGAMHANNSPLKGMKQDNWEGGIRTPFILSWPDAFTGGRIISTPVISLDILPTVLDAAGIEEPQEMPLDGKSILPVINGEVDQQHEYLFWSEGGETGEWAVRYNNWKLVVIKDEFHLSHLENDPSESTNMIDNYPDTADHMIAKYLKWLGEMADPMQVLGKSWIPKIESGQLASLYDRLYFRGNVQHFADTGRYHTASLTTIGDNQAKSVLLKDGYKLKAYSEDRQGGAELIIKTGVPYLTGPGDGLSSLLLTTDGVIYHGDIQLSASTEENTASNVLDGDYATYWDGIGEGEWIQFEFNQVLEFNGIRIAFKRGDRRVAYFDVETSEDGVTWKSVISGGASSGETRSLELFAFPATKAKYIRIIGQGNSDNVQNHYTEVEFSVTDIPVVDFVQQEAAYSGSSIILYPNPCIDELHVEAPDALRKFEIFDQSGRLILRESLDGKRFTLSVSGLNSGIYFARLYADRQLHHLKFIKSN